jgi:HK97 family phage major capsid protein
MTPSVQAKFNAFVATLQPVHIAGFGSYMPSMQNGKSYDDKDPYWKDKRAADSAAWSQWFKVMDKPIPAASNASTTPATLSPKLAALESRPIKRKGKAPFATLGEQLSAVRLSALADISGYSSRRDPRLDEIQRRAFSAAGNNEAVAADGGFLVQPEFARKLVKRMYRTGEVFSRCTQFPITAPNSNGVRFPQFDETSRANGSRLGGVFTYWENEADALTGTKPKSMVNELTARKLTALLYLTGELAEDTSADALDSWVSYAASQELLFALENSIVTGDGQSKPQGVLNSPALVTVAKESAQSAATVVSANIQKMLSAFWAASMRSSGAVWLYNQALLPQLSTMTTIAGTAGSESRMWHWAESSDDYNMICGIPALPSEYCSAPGTVGDLILADFSRYALAIREMIRNEVSIHVRFLTDESAYKFLIRVNGETIDKTPVTPLNGSGSTKTSPFVTLAAR